MARADMAGRWRRIAWFVGLWAGSILALGTVSMLIRFWLRP
ncbi:MAG: DUF2474 family protein [Pseudomonadota bacterium]|nr:DUF2474 family protein [Rhizorhabdus phycosphaerae]